MDNQKNNENIKVFISCKSNHYDIAEKIINKLDAYDAADNLSFFLARKIEKGKKWKEQIENEIQNSDFLLMLLLDKDKDLDWCLREAYMMNILKRPVICLQAEDNEQHTELPEDFKEIQKLKLEIKDLTAFLKDFYGTNKYYPGKKAINLKLSNNENETVEIANSIYNWCVIREKEHHKFGRNITLRFKYSKNMDTSKIPDDAEIIETDRFSFRIFGVRPTPPAGKNHWLWSDLLEKAGISPYSPWISQLTKSIFKACEKKTHDPIQATFVSLDSTGRTYLPVLERHRSISNGEMEISIIFVELFHREIDNIPEDLKKLGESMNIAKKLRWEVLVDYLDKRLPAWQVNIPSENDFSELQNEYLSIVEEAKGVYLGDSEALIPIFKPGEERNQFLRIYSEMKNIQEPIINSLKDRHIEDIRKNLEKLRQINNEYLILATKKMLDTFEKIFNEEKEYLV